MIWSSYDLRCSRRWINQSRECGVKEKENPAGQLKNRCFSMTFGSHTHEQRCQRTENIWIHWSIWRCHMAIGRSMALLAIPWPEQANCVYMFVCFSGEIIHTNTGASQQAMSIWHTAIGSQVNNEAIKSIFWHTYFFAFRSVPFRQFG